ncbi:hypothetical protein BC939DRAFT_456167 [Gamsiella multidivaricata]|uniref:uncharacterized protein n=1 Tax=Gamsiella multidivaricata TaxID=101098 RepID=UPI00221F7801|nr:uncharacterized protein BC939DRAFT_456167 [Gamsiella multidivaricata]KAI7821217.1 hypothetical protein BC939DRAFT_456167 [Gamsiella multidivaricata]
MILRHLDAAFVEFHQTRREDSARSLDMTIPGFQAMVQGTCRNKIYPQYLPRVILTITTYYQVWRDERKVLDAAEDDDLARYKECERNNVEPLPELGEWVMPMWPPKRGKFYMKTRELSERDREMDRAITQRFASAEALLTLLDEAIIGPRAVRPGKYVWRG